MVATGRMSLVEITVLEGEHEDQVLRLAGALEHASEHPIAKAISTAALERFGTLPTVTNFQNTSGLGVQGVVDDKAVVVGRATLLADWGIHVDHTPAQGRTDVFVAWDGK
ncbi:heavy metal translocating P-type ATPase, partial [Kibdelosporangium lantanae]